jgi:hypothetical protein
MDLKVWLGAAALTGVFAGGVAAATLTPTTGEVMLNTGAGYKPVAGAVEVKAGDSILVNPGGGAQLAYGDCATYEISPGDVVYVAEQETIPCVAGGGGGMGVGALGANGLLVGGLAVAVGVGVVAGVSSGSDSPASP